jgi:hypothetical protein
LQIWEEMVSVFISEKEWPGQGPPVPDVKCSLCCSRASQISTRSLLQDLDCCDGLSLVAV